MYVTYISIIYRIVPYIPLHCIAFRRVLFGGNKMHRATLACAFVNVFDGIREIHAEYARVMNREAVDILVDGIQATSEAGTTAADGLVRDVLHGLCCRLCEHGCISPVIISCLKSACFPKACKKYPTVWTGAVTRVTGAVGGLVGECSTVLFQLFCSFAHVAS